MSVCVWYDSMCVWDIKKGKNSEWVRIFVPAHDGYDPVRLCGFEIVVHAVKHAAEVQCFGIADARVASAQRAKQLVFKAQVAELHASKEQKAKMKSFRCMLAATVWLQAVVVLMITARL